MKRRTDMTQDETVDALRQGRGAAVITAHWKLIVTAAYRSRLKFVPLADRIQIGALHAWRRLDKYDAKRGRFVPWLMRQVHCGIRQGFYCYRTCHTPKRLYVDVADVATLEDVEDKLELEARLSVLDDVSRQWLVKNLRGEVSNLRSDGATEVQRSVIAYRRAGIIAKIQELV